jgi:[ribosomal protein S5]-alanine N-acetyltransferase
MTWPVRLGSGPVGLRPLRQRDAATWRRLRQANHTWLQPWEATPPGPGERGVAFRQLVRASTREARAGRSLPFAVTYADEMVGQLSVSGIGWGSMCSGHVGYWVSRHVAGRGIAPTAVAMVTDHCLLTLGLHRLEVNIRPENTASLRVVAKLGFRDEGVRERFLHIDGAWRDHRAFALVREDLPPEGLLAAWNEKAIPATRRRHTDRPA